MRSKRPLIVAAVTTVLGCAAAGLAGFWTRTAPDTPYSRIEDGLYLGTSVEQPLRGTQAVVNLCGRPDPYKVDPSLWIPIYEPQQPSLEILRRVVGFIDEQRRAGRTTYVHCMVGVNRSGAMVTAYLMQEHRMGRDEALAFLRKRRPEVAPDPTLLRLLSEWEQVLKTR